MSDAWRPTEKTLRRAAPHVAHDLALFRCAWKNQQGSQPGRAHWTVWFLLCRSLLDFFSGQCKGTNAKKRVCAWHFVGGKAEWKKARQRVEEMDVVPDEPTWKLYRHAASRLAAHVTAERLKYEEMDLAPDPEITTYVEALGRELLRSVPDSIRAQFAPPDNLREYFDDLLP